MAETILLNGVFKDDITPQLKKLTRSIDQLQKSFAKFGKSLRPIARDLGKVAAASERINESLKDQRKQTIAASKAWAVYRREVGKAGGAQRKAFGGVARGPRGPAAARGGGGVGGAVAGAGVGFAIGRIVEQGIVTGFRIGTQIMMKPFEYLASAIGERIQDELQDIMSAGGLFANDRRYGTGLFGNFGEARGFQEDLNRRLAESAAALPGATNDYVRAARQITDTIGIAFGKDQDAFNTFAQSLGGTGESLDSIATVLQQFTERAVMLNQAGGGRGGTMGLPMLLEQLINQESVNIGGLKRRYAALRANPLLSSALEDAQNEINAAGANTADRIKAVMKALDAALPDEVIAAMKTSMSGVLEAIRSSFLDPDTGLFGLGRLLKTTTPKVDALGRYIDENGKIVNIASEALQEQTTLYKLFREVVGGFMIPLSELTALLPELFDPLSKIADQFVELQQIAQEFYQNFNAYTEWFKQNEFEDDAGVRGALSAINKLLFDLGVISDTEALGNIDVLKDPSGDITAMFTNLMEKLFSSELMEKIGTAIGNGIGQIVSAVAQLMAGIKDNASSGFGKGLMDGFRAAGGPQAVKDIFKGVFAAMLDLLMLAVREAPLETAMVAGAVVAGPVIGGIVTAILNATLGPALAQIGVWIKAVVWPLLAPFALIAAKILLVIGAVMGLIAIFRHFDLIVKGLGIMLQHFGHALAWTMAKIKEGVFGLLAKVGLASQEDIDNARAEAEKHAAGMAQKRLELEQNTAESLARTAGDFEWIAGGFKTLMGGGAQPESGGSNVQQAPLTRATTQALNTSSAVSNIDKAIKKVGEVVRKQNELNRAKFTTMNTALIGMNNKLNGVLSVEIVKSIPLPMNIQMGGGATGSEQGGPSVFNGLAQSLGLMMTSGYRPNDTDSYHGINRARDYAGDPQQMMAFAQMMSSTFGGTLKELIYTPLGYSIKNGQVVPPYAQGTHYDHVHVAYGMGGGSPAFFSSKSAAQSWERRVAPSNSAIASVTSNSSEMGGRSVTVGNINISGVNDPKAIAETVAEEIMVALDRSSYTSLYNS